jgi:hypothetical protein
MGVSFPVRCCQVTRKKEKREKEKKEKSQHMRCCQAMSVLKRANDDIFSLCVLYIYIYAVSGSREQFLSVLRINLKNQKYSIKALHSDFFFLACFSLAAAHNS